MFEGRFTLATCWRLLHFAKDKRAYVASKRFLLHGDGLYLRGREIIWGRRATPQLQRRRVPVSPDVLLTHERALSDPREQSRQCRAPATPPQVPD